MSDLDEDRPSAPSGGSTTLRWSDPFDRLSVGDSFVTGGRLVEEADVMLFCALTGDWHPQHSDERFAAASAFGERIAHGMLIISLAAGLVPFDPRRVIALRRVSDVVFKRPVKLGETITVGGEVRALRALDDRSGLVELRWDVRNQDAALVCRAAVQVLWSAGEVASIELPRASVAAATEARWTASARGQLERFLR